MADLRTLKSQEEGKAYRREKQDQGWLETFRQCNGPSKQKGENQTTKSYFAHNAVAATKI
jgi:hypothetical protein